MFSATSKGGDVTTGPGDEQRRLEPLVGRWKTEGLTKETPAAEALRIDAFDTYEWVHGGFALLHLVDARVGDEKVDGAEIIGYDPARGLHVTQYFGSDGPSAYEAELEEQGDALVWRMWSANDRFTGTFDDDLEVLTGHWELVDEQGTWRPWMDITLTKQPAG
jgi:Protein of unknown function (DUF1579)